MTSNPEEVSNTVNRSQVLVGELPNDFLRIMSTQEKQDQMTSDSQLARQIAQQEMSAYRHVNSSQTQPTYVDRLLISVVEARLNKNYGITKMDPFCCVRVNHQVYETETCENGSKNPTWTRPLVVPITEPIDHIYLEIFDEGKMLANKKVAWTKIKLPDSVKNGETSDDWWPLTGELGNEKEGTVHIIFSKKKYQQTNVQPILPSYPGISVRPGTNRPQVQQTPVYTEEDIKQLKDLFPSSDDEVIKAVFEASNGNKNHAIDALLQMQ